MRDFRIDFHIDSLVDLGQAFAALVRTSGFIAEGLRRQAMSQAIAGVRSARTIRDGRRRHTETKRRRDALRRIRRMEMERRGWR